MAHVSWQCKPFSDLTSAELYAILRLRNEVFVVEQNCVFQDADNMDPHCYHFMGWIGNELAAYTRLVPKGAAYDYPSIGRVVTSPKYRGRSVGKELMQQSIAKCYELFGMRTIKIGAQLYLKNFYENLGFVQSGEVYDEDGIDHIHMLRNAG